MDWAGWLGIDMAVIGLVAVAVEVLLLLPRLLRLTKRINALTLVYETNQRLTRDELQILSTGISEMRVLLRPYRWLRRWLGHPVTLALLASYRRRATRRSQSPAR